MSSHRIIITSTILSLFIHFYVLKLDFQGTDEEEIDLKIPVHFNPNYEPIPDHKATGSAQESLSPELEETENTQGTDKKSLTQLYLRMLRERIEKNKFYPDYTRSLGLIGNVKIGFSILENGTFNHIQILRSSGDSVLDNTALNALKYVNGKIKRPKWAGSKTIHTFIVLKYQYDL